VLRRGGVEGEVCVAIAKLKSGDRVHAGQTTFLFTEGLATVIGNIEKESEGYGTYVREISEKIKR
jgi:hypothetical protein